MVNRNWTPQAGDILWLEFDPQSGHEQAGTRPGMVVSAEAFNKQSGLALICPITTKEKGLRFEVPLPPSQKVTGFILAHQVKCCDWKERKGTKRGTAPAEVLKRVREIIGLMIEVI